MGLAYSDIEQDDRCLKAEAEKKKFENGLRIFLIMKKIDNIYKRTYMPGSRTRTNRDTKYLGLKLNNRDWGYN